MDELFAMDRKRIAMSGVQDGVPGLNGRPSQTAARSRQIRLRSGYWEGPARFGAHTAAEMRQPQQGRGSSKEAVATRPARRAHTGTETDCSKDSARRRNPPAADAGIDSRWPTAKRRRLEPRDAAEMPAPTQEVDTGTIRWPGLNGPRAGRRATR